MVIVHGRLFRHMIQRGYPFGVIKVFASKSRLKKMVEAVEKWVEEHRGEEMSLERALYELAEVTHLGLYGLRFGLTFDPEKWYEPQYWSRYSYPAETAVKEGGDLRVRVYPWNKLGEAMFFSYVSFGIAASDLGMTEGVPLGVLATSIPRRTAIFALDGDNTVVCFTAHPVPSSVLRREGWKPIYENGVLIGWKKKFGNLGEALDEIRKLKNELITKGVMSYELHELKIALPI